MKIQSQRIKKDLSQKTAKTLPWFSFWSSSTWILKSFRRSREVSAALALLSVVSSVGKSLSYGVISLFVSGESSAVSLPQKLRNRSFSHAFQKRLKSNDKKAPYECPHYQFITVVNRREEFESKYAPFQQPLLYLLSLFHFSLQ